MALQKRSFVSSKSGKSPTLQKEMKLFRSFMIGVAGKDKEGAYRPEFVERILTAMNEKSIHHFGGAQSFLDHLHSA